MTERISPRQFYEAAGVEDWRVMFEGACAHFGTGSFGAGVVLMDAIGRLSGAARPVRAAVAGDGRRRG